MKELGAALSLLQMRRHLHSSPEIIRDEQTRRLRETVHHPYSTTPYYRNLLEAAGVRPRDINSLADLQRIPLTTKEDLLGVPLEDRISRGTDVRKCLKVRTSGTSGTPWEIPITPSEKLRRVLADLRSLMANGCNLFERTCIFAEPQKLPGPHFWFQHLGLLRRRYVSFLDDPESKLATLRDGNYDVICGWPSDLLLVAETTLKHGAGFSPPNILVTSGEVMQPSWHRVIRQAFGRDPTDFYGTVEFGYVAWQCPERQGYHVNADLFALELVNNGVVVEPGEEGEMVITDLAPRAMPLIRFATGDWSSSSGRACPCGVTLPSLSHISGRALDFLLLPSGKKVSPLCFNGQLKYVPGIKSFQVIQVSRSQLVARYTRHSDAAEDLSPAIVRMLRPVIGETMQIHVQQVASMACPRGKFRVVENALPQAEGPT